MKQIVWIYGVRSIYLIRNTAMPYLGMSTVDEWALGTWSYVFGGIYVCTELPIIKYSTLIYGVRGEPLCRSKTKTKNLKLFVGGFFPDILRINQNLQRTVSTGALCFVFCFSIDFA